MKDNDAYQKALQDTERDTEGGIDEKTLIDDIAELVDFDEAEERHKKATRIVRAQRKPGSTDPDGQISLPGFEDYAYEPERLIADDDGHVIEQAKAPVKYKQAQAERTRDTARRWGESADRAQKESADFASWVIEGFKAGRKPADLIFDHFVRETGMWSKGDAPPESEPGDDS